MLFDWTTFALQTVNFAVLLWLLHRFLYRPVLRVMDTRRQEIERQFDQARQAQQQAEQQRQLLEQQRAGLAAERQSALRAAAATAEQAAEATRAQAEQSARKLIEDTRASLAAERERALEDLQRMALELGADFARRLLSQMPMSARAEAWIERVEQHLREMPAEDVAKLTGGPADAAVTVTTAVPLPPATAESWHERLRRATGRDWALRFQVEPALIAGVELRFPQSVLSFTWQTTLSELRAQIAQHADAR